MLVTARRVFDHWGLLERSARLPRFSSWCFGHKDVLELLPAFTWHSHSVFRDLRHGFVVDVLTLVLHDRARWAAKSRDQQVELVT